MHGASKRLLSWVQLQLRKPDAKDDDLLEDKYMDPCSYFKETFCDGAKRAALFASPIQTDGPLAAPGARFV